MQRTLIIEPWGGLANRFCTLLSGMRLAKLYEAEFLLEWQKSDDCCVEFEDLFLNPFAKNTNSRNHCHWREICQARNELGWTNSPIIENFPEDKPLWLSSHAILATPGDNRHPRHYTLYDRIARESAAYFANLKPSEIVAQKLEPYRNINFSKVFGLHIRRPYPSSSPHHAHEMNYYNRPNDAAYIEMAGKILATGCFDKIFLATNDFATQQRLIDNFGDRIFFHPKVSICNESDVEAVQDALVDMILLSRCACLGRYNGSSFSYMASLLGLKPMLLIGQRTADSPVYYGAVYYKPDYDYFENFHIDTLEEAIDTVFKSDILSDGFSNYKNQTA